MRITQGAMVAALAIVAAAPAFAADLTLKGANGQTRVITDAELKALPHRPATMDDHGKPVAYTGVLIDDILPLMGQPREPLRGGAFAKVLIFRASDGYTVALTLAQTDQEFGAGAVVVVDGKDGKPLEGEGPFRLVVEGDKRPARSVRNLSSIELRDLK